MVLVSALVMAWPARAFAGPPTQPEADGSASEQAEQGEQGEQGEQPGQAETPEPPAPVFVPDPSQPTEATEPAESGPVEGAREPVRWDVPPPESSEAEPSPSFAPAVEIDHGLAPDDGRSMLVLGGVGIGLTAAGATFASIVGARRRLPASWLVPGIAVSSAGMLAFSGGALYLGVKRSGAHRRWLVARGLEGRPQGGGLAVGGSFFLLGAIGFVTAGSVALSFGDTALGATELGLGIAMAAAVPTAFVFSVRFRRSYAATGGWAPKAVPPLPTPPVARQPQLQPVIQPFPMVLEGGGGVGLSGRF